MFFILSRSLELLSRSHELVIRGNEILIRGNEILRRQSHCPMNAFAVVEALPVAEQ